MTAAGIVLYNADVERLRENINGIINQVDTLILIDNGSNNIEEIEKEYDFNEKIYIKRLGENKGIAKALNEIVIKADELGAEWVLTLDQDSVCQPGIIECYEKYTGLPDVAMMSCKMTDRNYSLGEEKVEEEYVEVGQCITSGCYMNISAAKKVGMFDEKMFIDYVDFDMCSTFTENGYKIILCNFNGLLHELGEGEVRRFLFKKIVLTKHSPIRRYYYVRNVIYYVKKHKKHISRRRKWTKLYGSIFYDIAVIVLYEDNKKAKLKQAFRGLKDGIKMKV